VLQTRTTVVVPKERVGVVVGPEGETRSRIQSSLGVNLRIESQTGIVEITPKSEESDAVAVLRAKDVVTAIARGFSPEKAFLLFDDEVVLDIIDLREIYGHSESDIRRIKGRVIGQQGKTRRIIEEMSKARLSIFGYTIGLIGDYESTAIAREAVEMILKGREHTTVYRFLRNRRREVKRRQTLELWEKTPRPP